MHYHPLIRYRVVANDGQVFEGYVYDREGSLWIYERSVLHGSYADDAIRRIYERESKSDFPFRGNEVRGAVHLATVSAPASVVPMGPPMTLDELLETRNGELGRW